MVTEIGVVEEVGGLGIGIESESAFQVDKAQPVQLQLMAYIELKAPIR